MKSVPLIGKVSVTAGLGWVWVDMGSEHAGLARIYTAARSRSAMEVVARPRRGRGDPAGLHGSRREAPQGPWRPWHIRESRREAPQGPWRPGGLLRGLRPLAM